MAGREKAGKEMAGMAKSLERDPQVESILRGRVRELGLEIGKRRWTPEARARIITRSDTDPIDDLLPYNWVNTNAGQTAFEMSNLASAA